MTPLFVVSGSSGASGSRLARTALAEYAMSKIPALTPIPGPSPVRTGEGSKTVQMSQSPLPA